MRPEDAMQALSPLGYPLPLSTSTGPDRKLSKALSKPLPSRARRARAYAPRSQVSTKAVGWFPSQSTLDPALA